METKHTKGEWVIYDSHLYETTIKTKKGVRIAEVKSFGNNKQFNDAPFEERDANAKLIAAAPELLEALILAKSLMVGGQSHEWELINNAIKKATE